MDGVRADTELNFVSTALPLTAAPQVGALAATCAALAVADDLDHVVALAAEQVRAGTGAATVSISRWEPDQGWLRCLVTVGELGPDEQERPEHEVYATDQYGFVARLLASREPCVMDVRDPKVDPQVRALLDELRKETAISVPIVTETGTWGELFVTSLPGARPFSAGDLEWLSALSAQVAFAVARAEILQRLTHLAYADALTGLPNRRALEERLQMALDGPGATVVMADLDNFKLLNDEQGHAAGDRALRAMGGTLVDLTRQLSGGTAYRIAGDEFCLLLEDSNGEAGHALAERALEALRSLGMQASFGVAASTTLIGRAAALMRAADAALYTAKRTGRGRICIAEPDPDAAWAHAAAQRPARRALRCGARLDVGDLCARSLAELDGLRGRSELKRLEHLLALVMVAVDASAGAISVCPRDSETVDTLLAVDRRSGRTADVRNGSVGDLYDLAEYPETARLLDDRDAMLLDREDPDADPAERELLDRWGMTSVLACGAVTQRGERWLLELYADGATVPLNEVLPALRLLSAEAVSTVRTSNH